MIYPSCQHDNDVSAKFCPECEYKFAERCANCGAELNDDAIFCSECGAPIKASTKTQTPAPRWIADCTPKHLADKILNSRSALEGERKHVTVFGQPQITACNRSSEPKSNDTDEKF